MLRLKHVCDMESYCVCVGCVCVFESGRNGRRHGDGRAPAAATMHARLFQRLIPFLIAEQ